MAHQQTITALRNEAVQIREKLDSGVTSVTGSDGTSVAIDPASLRKRLAEIESQLPEFAARRPRVSTYRLDV